MKDIDKRIFYIKVWIITENQPLHKLRNFKKRGWRKYHLDHIVSISHGFLNGLSPEQIGGMSNLRFIPWKENIRKGSTMTEASHRALRRIKRIKNK